MKARRQRFEPGIVGQVERERGDRYIAIVNHFDVGDMAGGGRDRGEAEPIIGIAAGVGALNDPQPAIIMEALAAHAHALDFIGC